MFFIEHIQTFSNPFTGKTLFLFLNFEVLGQFALLTCKLSSENQNIV